MGSGSTTQGGQQTSPHIPPWMAPLLHNTASQWGSAQGNLPDISQLYNQIPELQTAQLNSGQTSDIGNIQGIGNQLQQSGGAWGGQQQAGNQLENFLSTNGPSAATQQAEQNFTNFENPVLESQASLSGLGNSGAALEASATGAAQAAVPFLQQDVQNKLSAANQLGALGGQEFGQLQGGQQNALNASTIPQQLQQTELQNLFNQQNTRQQFGQQVQFGPESLFGNAIGGGSSTSLTTPSKF